MADAPSTTSKYNPDIKTFNGSGDVSAWITRVELVSKMTQNTNLATLIPLHLDGGALAVYMEMTEEEKADGDKLKDKLLEVFGDGAFKSYGKLVTHRYDGSSVDVYMNQLKTFARIVGLKGDAQTIIVKHAFIRGMPESVSVSLQQIHDVKNVSLQVVIERARILMENKTESYDAVNAVREPVWRQGRKDGWDSRQPMGGASERVGHAPQTGGKPVYQSARPEERRLELQRNDNLKCFVCGSTGHFARSCSQRKPVTCFKCGTLGHIASKCTENSSGN